MYRLVQTCQISETLLLCFQQRAQSPRLLWNLFNWACNKPSDAPRLLVIHGYDIIVHTYSKTARSWSKSIKEQRIVIISVSNPSRAVAVERKIRGASSARARGVGEEPIYEKKMWPNQGGRTHTERDRDRVQARRAQWGYFALGWEKSCSNLCKIAHELLLHSDLIVKYRRSYPFHLPLSLSLFPQKPFAVLVL